MKWLKRKRIKKVYIVVHSIDYKHTEGEWLEGVFETYEGAVDKIIDIGNFEEAEDYWIGIGKLSKQTLRIEEWVVQ